MDLNTDEAVIMGALGYPLEHLEQWPDTAWGAPPAIVNALLDLAAQGVDREKLFAIYDDALVASLEKQGPGAGTHAATLADRAALVREYRERDVDVAVSAYTERRAKLGGADVSRDEVACIVDAALNSKEHI